MLNKLKTGKLSLKNLKGKSREEWQELLVSNLEVVFIAGQVLLMLVIFRFRAVEAGIEYEVPTVHPDPSVEQLFPNPAYKAIVEARTFDFLESELAPLGVKNIFDFKFVKDPQMLESEILEWEERARSYFDNEEYAEALDAVEEVLLRNPYREAALELKERIEEKLQE